ncbi:granulocyte colony-stimulating factor receptor isoform X1 [Megalops cyprinoides]|uniref:granulocyte colony-stimulating factor receptor isoform X1 n=1 Tax=Megalops cyprinoides TaxID=118141 RepID=UPI00186476C1|nr:granulocyte colony-stimulating factor receptor isoform X1 [Megalops cyprinoides]
MELLQEPVIAVLFAFVIRTENVVRASTCAEIQVQAAVVHLGSSLHASCLLSDDCTLTKGRAVQVQWHLNSQLLEGHIPANQSSRISSVFIPRFADTRGYLTCCVRQDSDCQIVKGLEIRGGYPPSAPQNLTCLTNLTKSVTLSCKWDPGSETHLPTNYTLHTERRDYQTELKAYPLAAGVHSHTIPRADLSLYRPMRIWVTAQNALGSTSSEPLILDPMETAKFDPPVIVRVWAEPHRYGCLKLPWRLSRQQAWVTQALTVEIRFRVQDSEVWASETKAIPRGDLQRELEVCGLSHGTGYQLQMRVRYGLGPWSEWGHSQAGSTLERAPTGRLNVWLKVLDEHLPAHDSVQLSWKPSGQFRANGKNVSYHVFMQRYPGKAGLENVCTTLEDHCVFLLPKNTRKVYIMAKNSAGESSPIPVPVYQHRGLPPVADLRVSPVGDRSLLVLWQSPGSPAVTGYVVEWGPSWETDPRFTAFHLVGRNESSFLISAGIEPYRPYRISVLPRYKEGIGFPRTVEGYSRQKAPSVAPNLRVGEIHHTYVELTWDDTPLEQRNGIIQGYTIFYWDERGRTEAVTARPAERRVMLRDLRALSMYKAFIVASTEGGSVNGTIVTLKTASVDAWAVVITVMPVCVGFVLIIVVTIFACFTKQERLRKHFWPIIPDPANSSIKMWTEADTLKNYPAFQSTKDIQDPTPVHLSWFSLLEVPEGRPEKGDSQTGDERWLQGGDTSGPGESLSGSSLPPSECNSMGHRDSVPYATVVFACPYRTHARAPSPIYLRSDSTQPLLEEEPPSPGQYQNLHFQEGAEDGGCVQAQEESSAFWEDFPLLSALKINDV